MDKIQARGNLNRAVSIMGNSKLAQASFGKHYNKLSSINKKSMDKIQARWNLNRAVSIMGNSKLAQASFGKHYNKLSSINKKSMDTICRDGGCMAAAPSKAKK